MLAITSLEIHAAVDSVAQVDLAIKVVSPRRRVRVLKVGHIGVGTRIKGIDDHLTVDRASDLNATVTKTR